MRNILQWTLNLSKLRISGIYSAYFTDDRNYIAAARQVRPNVPGNVAEYLVSSYADLRKQQARDEEQKRLLIL
jgi:DNA replicative helicase MCM subunit Mcm2 (Cdc46/Mcm family)